MGLILAACGGGKADSSTGDIEQPPPDPIEETDAGPSDAGPAVAGPADAGPRAAPLPTGMSGSRVYGPGQGLSAGARSVGEDQGGNVWVASAAGLHVLRPGAGGFDTFTGVGNLGRYEALSVAGGRAGQAIVGYRGLFGGADGNDPQEMLDSGDADLFDLAGGGVTLMRHYDLRKGNIEHDRTALTLVFDRDTGNVWFGMNHGLDMWDEQFHVTVGHRHPEFATGSTIRSSNMRGVDLDEGGAVWMGMAYRTGILPFGANGGDFWGDMTKPSPLDVWPAGQSAFPGPDFEDHVHGIAVERAGVAWIASFGNGLARVDTTFSPPDIRYYRMSDGLPSEKLTDVVIDPDGTVWGGTSASGIFRLNPASGEVRSYLSGRGVADLYLETRPTGRTLYIATSGGLVSYSGP